MSYKKIVAGVATFAIASAMVVPAAFAITVDEAKAQYTNEIHAPVSTAQRADAQKVLNQANVLKAIQDKKKAETEKLPDLQHALEKAQKDNNQAAIDQAMDNLGKCNGSITAYTQQEEAAQSELDYLDKRYQEKYKKGEQKPEGEKPEGENTAKPESNKAEYVIIFDGKEYKLDEAGLKDLGLDVAYVKDWTSEKKNAIESAENTLKTLDRFVKRTTEIKVGDMIYTVDQLADVLKTKLAELKKADIKTTNLNALQQLTKFMKEIENGVNAKMKTDPAALKKSGGEADKKAAGKATAAKGGKHLPKTADAAPVAPFAAVAGSAALIAAGLVASRKVNA